MHVILTLNMSLQSTVHKKYFLHLYLQGFNNTRHTMNKRASVNIKKSWTKKLENFLLLKSLNTNYSHIFGQSPISSVELFSLRFMKIDISRSWKGLLQNIMAIIRFSKKGEFKVKKGESMSKTGQKQRKMQKNREIFNFLTRAPILVRLLQYPKKVQNMTDLTILYLQTRI